MKMRLLSMDRVICVVLGLLSLSSVSLALQCDKQTVSPHRWTSAEVAAPDSIEGQLRSKGLHWTLTQGDICVGAYVQDILEGRLNQPEGRGAIGKVVSVSITDDCKLATVDFGRGFSRPIYFSELCPVIIARGPKEQPRSLGTKFPVGWSSTEVAAPRSVEGRLRAQGMCWTKTKGEIRVGVYVQDIFEGRLNQPKGRGAIGKVVALSTATNGRPLATVDFGQGFSRPIYFSELCPVAITPCAQQRSQPFNF